MSRLDTALAHLGALDALAARDTPASRLDARVKALAALAVAVTAASFGRGEALRLLPLAAWPVALGALGDVPWRAVLLRLAIASPFALGVAAFEPLLDRAPAVTCGGVTLSAGAVAFVTIVLKFALALSAALVLVATTGFDAVCAALARLGAPRVVVTQLLLLYRYLFVLAEEATRMLAGPRAALARPAAPLGAHGRDAARTAPPAHPRPRRAARTRAMRCRGFDGELRLVRRPRLGKADLAFAGATALLLAGSRLLDLPGLVAWPPRRTRMSHHLVGVKDLHFTPIRTARPPWTASPSRSTTASRWAWSAGTVPASRRSSSTSPACSRRVRARCAWATGR